MLDPVINIEDSHLWRKIVECKYKWLSLILPMDVCNIGFVRENIYILDILRFWMEMCHFSLSFGPTTLSLLLLTSLSIFIVTLMREFRSIREYEFLVCYVVATFSYLLY